MKINNKRFQILASTAAVLVLLAGCGEEQKKETSKVESEAVQASKIEVIANENAEEVKVKAKDIDKNQSKSYYYDYNVKSEYDPNAKPANDDADVRTKPRTSVDANLHIRSPYEKVQIGLLVKKLSLTFRVKCSACHDDYANGIIGPSLLSRDSDYIYNKIADFKSGKKENPLMNDLIKKMSDEEIRTLANEIAVFNKEIQKMREAKK